MTDTPGGAVLEIDTTDRLNKALRIGKVKPGEMRKLLGVSESTMTNYLSGRSRPKDGMLRQWAFRCGPPVTFEWLAYGIEDGPDTGPEQGIPPFGCIDGPFASVTVLQPRRSCVTRRLAAAV
jgi:hypothetical protein